MISTPVRTSAPRVMRLGAPMRVLGVLAILLTGLFAQSAAAQEPPDSVPPPADSLAVPADTVPAGADTIPIVPDSLAPPVDSLAVAPDSVITIDLDTVPIPVMPSIARGEAKEWVNEVWEWDREGIRASRAVDVLELVSLVPNVVPLRGGDYGMPRTVSAFASGAGRIRVFWDGFELPPLEGGVVDLSRISIAGLERVRVERSAGEMRVEIWTLEQADPRPYTVVETGTGDLETNLFRGTFGHPRILGGKLHVALDRLDTKGTRREEPGTQIGFWLGYGFERERWGVRADIRRMRSERDTLYLPGRVGRSDWIVRGRSRIWGDAVAEAFVGKSWITDSDDDSLTVLNELDRIQYGLRVGLERSSFWASASGRLQDGDGVPGSVLEARGGVQSPRIGGVDGSLLREGWEGEKATSVRLKGWTRSLFGLSLFGSLDDGRRGVPFVPPLPPPPPDTADSGAVGEEMVEAPPGPRFTDRSATRLGAQFYWRGLRLSAARLSLEVDSLHPLGLPTDAGGLTLAGGKRKGYEAMGRLPLFVDGLSLRGTYQWWDDEPAWRYLPQRLWQGEIDFTRAFLASGNVEFLVAVGVTGRDPMLVPLPAEVEEGEDVVPDQVPWAQEWFGRLQIRIMTFRIYLHANNFTDVRENQDYPGRALPSLRTVFGVRWTLWN